ncbi:serine hydrolase [Candidatus Woesebacteria bacterium]|nr:serine hydrolase [Candidatus Woesebacteria bacterium]
MPNSLIADFGIKKSILTALLLGILLGLSTTLLFNRLSTTPISEFKEVRSRGGYTYINPLLECENVQSVTARGVEEQLQPLIGKTITKLKQAGKTDSVSFYFRDLNNGPWIGINEEELHSPASLVKIPIAITIYKLSEENPNLLSTVIHNDSDEDISEQNVKPERSLQANKDYTIDELIELMLVYSSNGAYDMLSTYLNTNYPNALEEVYGDLGVSLDPSFRYNPAGNILSVKQYASFFRVLYNSSYLSKNNSENMLALLSKSTYVEGLRAGVPDQVEVAHKFGERVFEETNKKQLHDCGVVYAPKTPYLLCVMTKGDELSKLSEVISTISAITYRTISQ